MHAPGQRPGDTKQIVEGNHASAVIRKWLGAGVPQRTATQVAEAMRQRGVQVVDVREDDEWHTGHIAGAVHIPLGALTARLAELDRDRPVVTVCRSGNRSIAAAKALERAGFGDVASMDGGMIGWTRSGLPVTR